MSESLTFLMGQYEARVPTDRVYSPHHMWLQVVEGETFRAGLTAYSVRLLQDVYFLDWLFDPPRTVQKRDEIGEVESSKAVSALYAPAAGDIVAFNPAVLDDPSHINVDNYGRGWLFDMQLTDETAATLLSAEQYVELLAAEFQKAERAIKGQMN